MKSVNGIDLDVGQEVFIMQTPIIGEHEFVSGTVVKLNKKTVTINANFHERFVRGLVNKDVNRYGHQIFVK